MLEVRRQKKGRKKEKNKEKGIRGERKRKK